MADESTAAIEGAGRAVYGDAWRPRLASTLGVSVDLLASVMQGRRAVSADLRARLSAWADDMPFMLAERHLEQQRAVAELRHVLRSA